MLHDEHFSSYVCIDGKALEKLPERLDSLVNALLAHGNSRPIPPTGLQPCFRYQGETNYDLFEWLTAAFRENNRSEQSLDDFQRWVREKLIVATAIRPDADDTLLAWSQIESTQDWCGISLRVPRSERSTRAISRLSDLSRLSTG